MSHPTDLLVDLRRRHTSAAEALLDPALEGTPRCVREALVLIRDTGTTLVRAAHLARLFRRPPPATAAEALLRKFRRHKGGTTEWTARVLSDTAEQWALPPNLQRVVTERYSSVTIAGVHFPWYGNPEYLTILGDGFPALTVRVLATDAGGPCRFQLVRRDDPKLRADVEGMTGICPTVRAERLGEQKHPDIHYQVGFCEYVRRRGLDGELDLDGFNAVLHAVYMPPSYWHRPAPRVQETPVPA